MPGDLRLDSRILARHDVLRADTLTTVRLVQPPHFTEAISVAAMPVERVVARPPHVAVPVSDSFAVSRVGEVKLFNPGLAELLAGMRPSVNGIPREQLSFPISFSGKATDEPAEVTDEQLFEAPADATQKFYLPRYRLKEQNVSGQLQFQVKLEKSGTGGSLTVNLEKYPAASIAEASRSAQEIKHAVTILLKYNVLLGGVQKELEFQEVTAAENGLRAVLRLNGLGELTQVYQAISQAAHNAQLIVRRLIEVAIPVSAPSPEIENDSVLLNSKFNRLTAMRHLSSVSKLRLTPIRISDSRLEEATPPEQPSTPRFRQTTRTLDVAVNPFVFPAELHSYVFQGAVNAANGNQGIGLIRRQLAFNGTFHSYYQDQAQPRIFYYLPDSFKIARRPESPHFPFMSVRFASSDGTPENIEITLEYVAAPFVDPDRLKAAANELKSFINESAPNETLVPGFQPLLANSTKFRIALPRAGTSAGPFQERAGALIDLRAAVHDALTLSMRDFQAIYDALFGGSAVLFKGEIIVDVGGGTNEIVPFNARLNDLAGELFDYREMPDTASGGVAATLRNAIESPVSINNLTATLDNGETESAATLQNIAFDPPPVLKPGEEISFIVAPSAALNNPNNKPFNAVFDLDGVVVQPDREAVWNAILDPFTPAEYMRQIQIKMFKEMFAVPPDKPESQIMSIVLDFEHGDSIDLTADKLEDKAALRLPISDLVLRRTDTGAYRYRVTVIRRQGRARDENWRTDNTGILFPDVA